MSRRKKSSGTVAPVLELARYEGLTEYVSLDLVRPLEGNARVHTDEQLALLAESIRRFGVYRPLVVHRATGQILAGNGLYEAARRAGLSELPVVWFDGSESDALALSLTDNRIGELSDWDYSLLSVLASRVPDVLDKASLDAEFRSALESLAGELLMESESYIADASVGVSESDVAAVLESSGGMGLPVRTESVSDGVGSVSVSSSASSSAPEEVRHAGVYVVRLDAEGLGILSRWGALLGLPVNGDLITELIRRSALWLEEYHVDDGDDS